MKGIFSYGFDIVDYTFILIILFKDVVEVHKVKVLLQRNILWGGGTKIKKLLGKLVSSVYIKERGRPMNKGFNVGEYSVYWLSEGEGC